MSRTPGGALAALQLLLTAKEQVGCQLFQVCHVVIAPGLYAAPRNLPHTLCAHPALLGVPLQRGAGALQQFHRLPPTHHAARHSTAPGGLPYGFPVFGCIPGRAFNAVSGCVAPATLINLTPPSPILVRGSSNGLVFILANLPAVPPSNNHSTLRHTARPGAGARSGARFFPQPFTACLHPVPPRQRKTLASLLLLVQRRKIVL